MYPAPPHILQAAFRFSAWFSKQVLACLIASIIAGLAIPPVSG